MDNKYWDSVATERVALCDDGKYRWRYDVNLFKDLDIYWLIFKVMFFSLAAIFAIGIISDIVRWGFDSVTNLKNYRVFLYITLGMTVISALSYFIYAAIMGKYYCIVFEMDEHGVNHRQTDVQAKKAKKIAAATTLAGAASGSLSTMSAGLGASRTEMYTEFSKVKKVKPYRRKKLIKVNEVLNHNRVYAHPDDFDFVYNYIVSHCENLK